MNGRLYDPRLGRMLSPDPIIKDGSLASNYDRFAYAFNNPLMYTDPSGYIARLNDPSPQSAFTSTDPWSLPTVGFTVDGVPVAPQIAKGFLGRGGGGAAKVEYHSTHILGDHSVNHYDAVTYAEDNNLSYMPYLGYGKVADGLYKGRGEGFSIWENSLTGTYHVFDANTNGAAIFTSAEELMEAGYSENKWKDGEGLLMAVVGGLVSTVDELTKGSTFRLYNKSGTNFSPQFYQNGWKGGSRGNVKTYNIKFASKILSGVGYVMGYYNAVAIEEQYASGEISMRQRTVEQIVNTASTFSGIYGAAISLGWELGRLVTHTTSYRAFKRYVND